MSPTCVTGLIALMIPLWIVAAKFCGLYEQDEEQVDHSTVDDVVQALTNRFLIRRSSHG